MSPLRRLPISARHAFALAFDLAVRRDPLQSLWVPLLLHAPWLLASALLPFPTEYDQFTRGTMITQSIIMVGETITWLTIGAMLRFRARSVFNTPPSTHPAPLLECYSRGFRRIFWLYVSEFARYAVIFGGFVFLFFPGMWLAFRLSMVTEAVVLRERNTVRAFTYSFRVTDGRLERWLEMIVGSVGLLMAFPFLCVIGFLVTPGSPWSPWVAASLFLMVPVMSIVQYAWTFFYLRLEEIDVPRIVSMPTPVSVPMAVVPRAGESRADEPHAEEPSAPSAPAPPRLTLVEGRGPQDPPRE